MPVTIIHGLIIGMIPKEGVGADTGPNIGVGCLGHGE